MKKISIFLIVLTILSPLLFMEKTIIKAENLWDIELEMKTKEEVDENFEAYFISTQSSRRQDKFEYSWSDRNGYTERVNNIDTNKSTENIAVLAYKGNKYADFEMSVDYKNGNKTGYWAVLGIRQKLPGINYTMPGGGAGVFMQQNGKITMWGSLCGGIVEKDAFSNYYPTIWHNMRVKAQGSLVTVWVDDVEVMKQTVSTTDYIKGYVSLMSVNNDCAYKNFKIKSLDNSKVIKNEEYKYENLGGESLDDLAK